MKKSVLNQKIDLELFLNSNGFVKYEETRYSNLENIEVIVEDPALIIINYGKSLVTCEEIIIPRTIKEGLESLSEINGIKYNTTKKAVVLNQYLKFIEFRIE